MRIPSGSKLNRRSYDAISHLWDASRADFYGREREYIDAMLEGLPQAAHILDLGCGTGRPIAEYIMSNGHRVTGVDQSEGQLDIARTRYPDATWITSAIESFTTTERFNVIVCWDALFHIDRAHHEKLFARFVEMLLPGGRLMITVGGSQHPAFTDTMHGETFYYDSHPPEKVREILDAIGFDLTVAEFMNEVTSEDKGRYAIVAHLR